MFHDFASLAAAFHAVSFAAAKSTTTKSSSSSGFYLILLFIVVVAYLWIRPQRKRMRQQQAVQREFEVGDEVITGSGIVGRVQGINGDRIELEIAPGTTIQILRQAVARRADPPANDDVSDDDEPVGPPEERHEHADDDSADHSKWWPQESDEGPGDTPSQPGGNA